MKKYFWPLWINGLILVVILFLFLLSKGWVGGSEGKSYTIMGGVFFLTITVFVITFFLFIDQLTLIYRHKFIDDIEGGYLYLIVKVVFFLELFFIQIIASFFIMMSFFNVGESLFNNLVQKLVFFFWG